MFDDLRSDLDELDLLGCLDFITWDDFIDGESDLFLEDLFLEVSGVSSSLSFSTENLFSFR